MSIALERTLISLTLESPETAPYLEELLWTLNSVESVTMRMNDKEQLQELQVIGNRPDLNEAIQALCKVHGLTQQVQIGDNIVLQEEDWAESWKRYWHVARVLPRLIIQPSWESFTPLEGDIVLRLDPGSAFGTGTHETTRLMLFLLGDSIKAKPKPPETLLDVGTGSGILAIYGAKLGCSECVALDNDPQALVAARQNIVANQVEQQVHCSDRPLDTLESGKFELIMANILASVLQTMLPELNRVLISGGTLMMSGITRQQYRQMATAIQEQGLILQRVLQEGDWIALVCQKP